VTDPLFRRVLGAEAFDALPPNVRAIHSVATQETWHGTADITRGTNAIANLCAKIAGLPGTRRGAPTSVTFVVDGEGERWHRDFGGARMSSRYRERNGVLFERLGPMEFVFSLGTHDGEILWHTVGVRLLGVLPLPSSWFTQVRCRERERDGRYEFLVEAAMPLIGRIIRYEGWLGHP
jgi:hypothetical protein